MKRRKGWAMVLLLILAGYAGLGGDGGGYAGDYGGYGYPGRYGYPGGYRGYAAPGAGTVITRLTSIPLVQHPGYRLRPMETRGLLPYYLLIRSRMNDGSYYHIGE